MVCGRQPVQDGMRGVPPGGRPQSTVEMAVVEATWYMVPSERSLALAITLSRRADSMGLAVAESTCLEKESH